MPTIHSDMPFRQQTTQYIYRQLRSHHRKPYHSQRHLLDSRFITKRFLIRYLNPHYHLLSLNRSTILCPLLYLEVWNITTRLRTHTTLIRLQETTLLQLYSTPLSSHHYKMSFFGKHTIVRKVITSIKKEVSLHELPPHEHAS